MKRPSFVQALDKALKPLGFERDRSVRGFYPEWRRRRGEWLDTIVRDTSRYSKSVTVSLSSYNVTTAAMIEGIPYRETIHLFCVGVRIGHLMESRTDVWWDSQDPNAPTELAEVVRSRCHLYFDRFRTLADEAEYLGRYDKAWNGWSDRIRLAVTLHRMGETQEACEALRHPRVRLTLDGGGRVDAVRRWLGCGVSDLTPDQENKLPLPPRKLAAED